jgi:aromatic ring-opening dioxygenase LigB subunit
MAITAAALVPHPPLLVPEVGRGASPELDQLRSACRRALAVTLDQADALLVVGPAPSWGEAEPGATGSFAPYGVAVEARLPATASQAGSAPGGEWLDRRRLPPGRLGELPLSLTVAAWLLGVEAQAHQLPPVAAFGVPASMDAEPAAATGRTVARAVRPGRHVGLLVMGDLSARRTAKAPATFHPAAEEFDRGIGDAIREAEITRLLDADAGLAAELRVGGMAALWLLAGALEGAGPLHGEVLYEAAPFGVGYLVGVLESR